MSLSKGGAPLAKLQTDNYGDFKFDNLDQDSGSYTIEISHPDRGREIIEVRLGESQYVGVICLE